MAPGRDRSTVVLLAVGQALFMSASVIGFAFGGLVGYALADNKAFATAPITMTILGAALSTVPASFFMRRFGRRAGFLIGAACGAGGGALAIHAIYAQDFVLFCLANLLFGVYRGIAQYYRFAATDVAGPEFRARAISYVLAGGVVAAVVGPQLAIWTRDLLAPVAYAGAYVAVTALGLVALLPLGLLRIAKPSRAQQLGPIRPLGAIMSQPAFVAAAFNAAGGYALMNLLMTATPLSMVAAAHSVDEAALVIQWHVLAMFLPSFVTGHLITRFGLFKVLFGGMIVLAVGVAVAVSGVTFSNFNLSMIMVGVAWNCMYVGGSALLTETCTVSEQAKTQAVNEFMVVCATTVASLSSGVLLNWMGRNAVNVAALPVLALIAVTTLWYWMDRRAKGVAVPVAEGSSASPSA